MHTGPLTHGWAAICSIVGLSSGINATIWTKRSLKASEKKNCDRVLECAFQKVE